MNKEKYIVDYDIMGTIGMFLDYFKHPKNKVIEILCKDGIYDCFVVIEDIGNSLSYTLNDYGIYIYLFNPENELIVYEIDSKESIEDKDFDEYEFEDDEAYEIFKTKKINKDALNFSIFHDPDYIYQHYSLRFKVDDDCERIYACDENGKEYDGWSFRL